MTEFRTRSSGPARLFGVGRSPFILLTTFSSGYSLPLSTKVPRNTEVTNIMECVRNGLTRRDTGHSTVLGNRS